MPDGADRDPAARWRRSRRGIPALVAARPAGPDGGAAAATAIMTTDTVRKEVVVDGGGFTVGGMAKGAAMLAPNMATMLAVLTTDAALRPADPAGALWARRRRHLQPADRRRVHLDQRHRAGAGQRASRDRRPVDALDRRAGPRRAATLAGDDGGRRRGGDQGGPRGRDRARRPTTRPTAPPRKVADSNLVKCSLNGEDPYWGRVVSELGSAGVAFDIDRVEVAYGGVVGVPRRAWRPTTTTRRCGPTWRAGRSSCAAISGSGAGAAAVLTTDLGHGYIDENRTTS